MSNKVIFNLDELFISVGIDVGADFSWMSIALPNQQFVGKPYKILHNSIDSLTTAVSKIKEAEELYSLESRIFLESTGIYHYPLFCYLRDKGFNCSVINPIITKNSTNINIRKVHNDRFDSNKNFNLFFDKNSISAFCTKHMYFYCIFCFHCSFCKQSNKAVPFPASHYTLLID